MVGWGHDHHSKLVLAGTCRSWRPKAAGDQGRQVDEDDVFADLTSLLTPGRVARQVCDLRQCNHRSAINYVSMSYVFDIVLVLSFNNSTCDGLYYYTF